MVIGNGLIARRFKSYNEEEDVVIFASGVSNSKSLNEEDYAREKALLKRTIHQNKNKVLVYFSTCSIYEKSENNSQYVLHKKEMEELIQSQCKRYNIFRVSNLVGKSSNPNTVLNFFVYHITKKINFDLWANATRNLIDVDDMYKIVDYILKSNLYTNSIINIANPKTYTTKEIVTAIEKESKIKAGFIPISKGIPFDIDITVIAPIIKKSGIRFGNNYLTKLLRKYYFN